jgi:hypothetical protein
MTASTPPARQRAKAIAKGDAKPVYRDKLERAVAADEPGEDRRRHAGRPA